MNRICRFKFRVSSARPFQKVNSEKFCEFCLKKTADCRRDCAVDFSFSKINMTGSRAEMHRSALKSSARIVLRVVFP